MDVETRSSLPIDGYSGRKNYNQLLVEIYNSQEFKEDNLSQQRVRNLVTQLKR